MTYQKCDTVLIQQASAEWKPLLRLTAPIHAEYCDRHNMDYWPVFGVDVGMNPEREPYWALCDLIRKAFISGYQHIICLDCDCLIVNPAIDLREACPENAFGMVWHSSEQWALPREYDHWNSGAMYIHVGRLSQKLLAVWWHTSDEGHHWIAQHALNLAWRHLQSSNASEQTIQKVDTRFNSTVGGLSDPDPVVMAWHGGGPVACRYEAMKAEIAKRGLR